VCCTFTRCTTCTINTISTNTEAATSPVIEKSLAVVKVAALPVVLAFIVAGKPMVYVCADKATSTSLAVPCKVND
jgi:hypothetical protein